MKNVKDVLWYLGEQFILRNVFYSITYKFEATESLNKTEVTPGSNEKFRKSTADLLIIKFLIIQNLPKVSLSYNTINFAFMRSFCQENSTLLINF